MQREIFVSNDKYILYPLADEDRSGFEEVNRQVEGETELVRNHRDEFWNLILTDETKYYSIYDMNGEFQGIIELQKPDTSTPRIGLSIMEHCRNKGVAPSVVPMFAKKVREMQEVECFIIKISKSNSHSRHVFEKLGAVYVEEQDSDYLKAVKRLTAHNMDEENKQILKEAIEEDDPSCIYTLNI